MMNTRNDPGWIDARTGPYRVASLRISPDSDPIAGSVQWDVGRTLWNAAMLMGALVLGPIYFTWDALFICVLLLELTMCAGHSVGFHRRLIHRTFECPKWVERILVWLGVLVGMHGPFWVIRSHDIRDWAQRQTDCHDFLKHGQGFLMDGWWNLCCRLKLTSPPEFDPGPGIADDWFYQSLQRTWMLQQVPIGAALYLIGGMPWLVWGVFVRVAVGVSMHWMVGYFCHTHGPQNWLVDDGAVQAHDVPWAALPSMGESWHNNHHAFPASAKHGIFPAQIDPGYRFIRALERLGLAWNVNTVETLPVRRGVTPVTDQARLMISERQQLAA